MLKKTREFYELTRLTEEGRREKMAQQVPLTFVKIFHKKYPRLKKTRLPKRYPPKELDDLFKARKSERNFCEKSLSFYQVAEVLHSCRILNAKNYSERRTYPSGGARFPVEVYFLALNVKGIENGAYHYDMVGDCLEALVLDNLKKRSRELFSPYVTNAAAGIVLTSVISRSEIKYLHKALPFSYIEAGHMGQNIVLTCAKRKIGCCPICGFVDDTLKEILDLTDDEIPLYVMGLGIGKGASNAD